jgi:hypothetical protein
MLKDPGRYAYWPFVDRPWIRWPNGARVAFWVAPNVEFYEIDPPDWQGRPVWGRPRGSSPQEGARSAKKVQLKAADRKTPDHRSERLNSKQARVLALLHRPGGVTVLPEKAIMRC